MGWQRRGFLLPHQRPEEGEKEKKRTVPKRQIMLISREENCQEK